MRAGLLIFFLLGTFPLAAQPIEEKPSISPIDLIDALVESERKPTEGEAKELSDLLLSPESSILEKERAAWAIGELNLRGQAPALVKACSNKGLLVRSAALGALMRMRARSGFDTYIAIAESDPALILRQKATLALGLLRWERAIKPLVKLSNDLNDGVRGASVLAMAATHSNRNDFSEVMKEMVQDKSPYVRERAILSTDIIQRKNKAVQTQLGSEDMDVRLFAALYFHHHGKKTDLDALQAAYDGEAKDDVRFALSQAIKGTQKRIKRIEEKRKAAARAAAEKKKKAAAEAAQKTTSPPAPPQAN